MKKKLKHIIISGMQAMVLPLILLCVSCLETFDFQSEIETYQSVLVIEAIMTNELKKQEIVLSRTFRLEEDGPSPESGATITVVDDFNTEYIFRESDSSGTYVSTIAFAAEQDVNYTLHVITSRGKAYTSSPEKYTNQSKIESIYAERGFNLNAEEGVSIYVNSFDPTGKSKYYRYEYEETYKIIAPLYKPYKLIVIPPPPRLPGEDVRLPEIHLIEREEQVQICYNTVNSNEIMIAKTNNHQEDRIKDFPIRFITSDNYILARRYSILVRQYVQSSEAHAFYETLKTFSKSESLFSEIQLGFIQGNVFSVANKNEPVLGYFELSSVDIKRIYFNYEDFFPDMTVPYYIACDWFINPEYVVGSGHDSVGIDSPLADAILSGLLFYDHKTPPFDEFGEYAPYILIPAECGDCTNLGKTKIPDFWID